MKRQLKLTCSFITIMLSAQSVSAQNFDFIADYVRYEEPRQWVVIDGDIEISTEYGYFYPDFVQYEIENQRLYVDGQLNGVLPDGQKFITQYTELDFKTQNAIAMELRAIIEDEVQIATLFVENSTEENYQYAENVVASSCKICASNPTPIWQFNAQQVYRDFDEEKIYMRNAFFELFGVPIFWLPYFRYPDADAKRMDGFLTPELISSNANLTGVKLPYYFFLSEYTDFTITPYINTSNLQIVEGEIRHSAKGLIYQGKGFYLYRDEDLDEAVIAPSLGRQKTDGQGRFLTNHKLRLSFPYQITGALEYWEVSDYDFAADYGYSRPTSNKVELSQYKNNHWFSAESYEYLARSQASIDSENSIVLPHIQGGYRVQSNFGLQLDLGFDYLDLDKSIAEDTNRLVLSAEVNYTDVLAPGVLYNLNAGSKLGLYEVENNDLEENNGEASLITNYASLDVALPLKRSTQNSSITLTPRLHTRWSESQTHGVPIPNNDANWVEHDTVSIFAQDMILGDDRDETGLRMSVGIFADAHYNDRHHFDAGVGRSWQSESVENVNEITTPQLDEWVAYANYTYDDALSVYMRWAFDDALDFSRNEIAFSYDNDYFYNSINWVSLSAEPDIGFSDPRAQISTKGDLQFLPNWKLDYSAKLDPFSWEPFDAGFGLTYGNECIEIGGEIDWKFNQGPSQLETERTYSFSLQLPGISGKPSGKWAERTCRY